MNGFKYGVWAGQREPPDGLLWTVGEAFQSEFLKTHINTTKIARTSPCLAQYLDGKMS